MLGKVTEKSASKRIVVLISGSGSNLQAIIDAIRAGDIPATIEAVISNKAGAFGLERAQNSGIKTEVVDHTAFPSRGAFDQALASVIDKFQPDIVVLAGFMRILTDEFVNHYLGKMINIHPSLLPKFQGLNTHQRAIDDNEAHHGATVHYVIPELDGGPPILQASVPLSSDETSETLASKVLTQEHIIYPLAVKWLAENKLSLNEDTVYFEGKPLPSTGVQLEDLSL